MMAGLLTRGLSLTRTFPNAVRSVVFTGVARHLQLRGQLRIWRLLAPPHRIPISFRTHIRLPETIATLLGQKIQNVKRLTVRDFSPDLHVFKRKGSSQTAVAKVNSMR